MTLWVSDTRKPDVNRITSAIKASAAERQVRRAIYPTHILPRGYGRPAADVPTGHSQLRVSCQRSYGGLITLDLTL